MQCLFVSRNSSNRPNNSFWPEKQTQGLWASAASATTLLVAEPSLKSMMAPWDFSVFTFFLGEVSPQIEILTRELAEAYESKVQFRQFTDAVERGCGPDCGTDAAAGCGTSGGCSTCAIASACGSSKVGPGHDSPSHGSDEAP